MMPSLLGVRGCRLTVPTVDLSLFDFMPMTERWLNSSDPHMATASIFVNIDGDSPGWFRKAHFSQSIQMKWPM